MKVVQINSECGRGSTGKIAKAISELLTEHSVENYVFYSGNHKSDYPLGIRINSKPELRIHQILSRIFGDQGFHSTFTTLRLVKNLKKINPDIIHLHNLHGYYLNFDVLFRYLAQSGIRVVWTLHDCWAFTGHCTHFTLQKCVKWKTMCHDCPRYHDYPYSLFFDRSKTLFNRKKKDILTISNMTIVTPSRWLADLAKLSFLGKYKIAVINNGINLNVFQPTNSDFRKKYNCEDKYIVLGVASVWSEEKGLLAFQQLAEDLDDQYQIVLVGTDDKVDKLIPNKIISIHRTSNQQELAAIYSAADVFVNPTLEENYPTVNMEAIACGTFVVTYQTGGSAEMVNTNCGSAVAYDDYANLREQVKRACDFRNGRCHISKEIVDHFNEQSRYQDYLKLYFDIYGDKD